MKRKSALAAAFVLGATVSVTALAKNRDEFDGTEFFYIDQADRVQVLTELCHALRSGYALWEIKKERIQVDGAAVCAEAIEAEKAVADPADVAGQAKANLEFFDRARRLSARFRDSHFFVGPVRARTRILLPIAIEKTGQSFRVARTSSKLLQYMSQQSGHAVFSKIRKGDEVLEIDGKTPTQAMEELKPYLSASSPGALERYALITLTQRSFRLPEKGAATLRLRLAADGKVHTLVMPWFYQEAKRADEKVFFAARGFRAYKDLRYHWDERKSEWKLAPGWSQGYEPALGLEGLAGAREYVSVEGDPVLRGGYWIDGGKVVGVLQVFTFGESTVVEAGKQEQVPFIDALRSLMKDFAARGVDLVLDLRNNPGGQTRFPPALLSLLAPKGARYANFTNGFRVTRYVRQMSQDELALRDFLGEAPSLPLIGGITDPELRQLIADAVVARQTHTDGYTHGDIEADPELGGFAGKVVALISPDCVSSCDLASWLLRHSKRAILIGQPTNGTGAGFRTSDAYSTQWKDSYSVLRTNIPSFLFGPPSAEAGLYRFRSGMSASAENIPVQPDIAYETTEEDLMNGDRGWMRRAIQALEGK